MPDVRTGPPRRWEVVAYRLVRAVIVLVAKAFGRITVTGTEHLPASGSFVLAPVHRSNVDFALASIVTTRRMRFMGKDSLWNVHPLASRFLSALGGFPVNRGSADRDALRACRAIVEAGEPLVMFPEGTRCHGPELHPLFDGPAYVASRTGVPIIPVGIGGSEKAMPRGSKMIRPTRLSLVVGPPIPAPASRDGRVPRSAVRATTARLGDELQVLFDRAQGLVGDPNPSRSA